MTLFRSALAALALALAVPALAHGADRFVFGAMAATSAAIVMKTPAEASRDPCG